MKQSLLDHNRLQFLQINMQHETKSVGEDKILITIYQSKNSMLMLGSNEKSFYVPLQANVHYLRTFLSGKISNSRDSIFLFAYGNLLNNNQTMQSLRYRFKGRMRQQKGLEIQIASMASF